MLKKRLPEEDINSLENILLSDDWKILLKYVAILHNLQEQKFFLKPLDKDMLLFERGRVEGSKDLLKSLTDFKDYFRAEYVRKRNKKGNSAPL